MNLMPVQVGLAGLSPLLCPCATAAVNVDEL
jgi:hypothetical protein